MGINPCSAGIICKGSSSLPLLQRRFGVSGAFYGGQTTYENDPNKPNFIPYENLTKAIVLGWIYETLGSKKAEIEATLTAKVEKQLSPTTVQGTPWLNQIVNN